ncbi:hypothetical protein ACPPVS_15990 [Cellulomonas sp. McL0617]|uniref:hypothetical protein n=1 Tax=Cellulomonas sp. McL0617 TaxID=3415675 RepID=UPI003CF0854C
MADLRGRDRWVWWLAQAASVVAVAVWALARALDLGANGDGPFLLVVATVVVVASVGVAWRPRRAARFAWLYAVPATLASWAWLSGTNAGPAYFLTVQVGTASALPALPAFDPSPLDNVPGSAGTAVIALLVGLLWTLATFGLVALVRDARPGTGSMHVLAVVASVLSVSLYAGPALRHLHTGLVELYAPAPAGTALAAPAVATLLIATGGAVVASRNRVPARAGAYLLPAVALTWLVSTAGVDTSYGFSSSQNAGPTWVDALPWTAARICTVALLLIAWVLAVRGLRALLVRYRPPTAVEERTSS